LQHLDNTLVARYFFNSDYAGEVSDMGDTVRINQIGAINIFNYVRNQDMAPPQELSGVSQDLVIDQANAFNFQIDDVDNAQTHPKLMDAAMERSAFHLADREDSFLFGTLAAGAGNNIAATTITSPDDLYMLLLRLRTIMSQNNVPTVGRQLAAPAEVVSMLLADDRFVNTGSDSAEFRLQGGIITRGLGFEIREVNTTPGDNTIIAGHSIGATFASQIVKTEAYRMEARFADGLKGLNVYGARVTIPGAFATAVVNF
jgi:hypothetical protein